MLFQKKLTPTKHWFVEKYTIENLWSLVCFRGCLANTNSLGALDRQHFVINDLESLIIIDDLHTVLIEVETPDHFIDIGLKFK
jgi:hypothetical protein